MQEYQGLLSANGLYGIRGGEKLEGRRIYSGFGKPCPCAIFKKKIGWPDRSSRGLSPVGSTTEMGVDIGHAYLCTLQ